MQKTIESVELGPAIQVSLSISFARHGFIPGRGVYNVPQQRPEWVVSQKGDRFISSEVKHVSDIL